MTKKIDDKLILITLILVVLLTITICIVNNMQYKKYESIVNTKIAEILIQVKEKYPNVEEKEIIKVLNNKDTTLNENFISKYGYTEDTAYVQSINENKNKLIYLTILVVTCFGIVETLIIAIYQHSQKKEVIEINDYLKKLNQKNYKLEITKNGEDELSKLRNELYKTTILLKEMAEKNEKEKEQLSNSIADVSHQLKTPLTSIRIMLDNIYENPEMDEKTRQEFIKDISRQVDWISSLVIALLKIARFDAGVIKMNDKEIKVKDLLQDIVSSLSVLIEVKGINVIINTKDNIKVNLDYNWQKEAITNIVKNAIEHSKYNSNVYIDVENSSLFVKIKIRDEGEGISKEEKRHIFERFYKSNESDSNNIGIGLSLAKTIIEKDCGEIKVNSELGIGTTFEIEYIK